MSHSGSFVNFLLYPVKRLDFAGNVDQILDLQERKEMKAGGNMRLLALVLMTIGSVQARADIARFSGTGQVVHPIEHVELTAIVHSECYSTPAAAKNVADALAESVFREFELAVQDNQGDQVLSHGGYTQPYVRHNQGRSSCLGTFQKTIEITLITSSVENFENLFNTLQESTYALPQEPASPSIGDDQALAWVTLGQPQPRISDATRQKMEVMALNLAVENAITEFEGSVAKACGVNNYRIVGIDEPSATARPAEWEEGRGLLRSSPSASAPVRFDQERIEKTIHITFEYDSTWCEITSNKSLD